MNKALMVGYLEGWEPANITFTQAAEKGYDTIIMAFGTINGTTVGEAFYPLPTQDALKKDIRDAKTKGAKHILFSVGGANNTYNPENASADNVAQAIVSHLQEFGFTGIDFDIEIETDADYLDQLCAEIRKVDSSMLITAAPQVNQADVEHLTDLYLVSKEHYQIYNKAVENKRFDYLFIQVYNNSWPQIDGRCGEQNVCFISAAFKNLKKSIPVETMITIGEPANINASESINVFKGPDAGKDIYNLMADQYKSIRDDEQFGGAMVWDINWDAKSDYQFINTIKSAI